MSTEEHQRKNGNTDTDTAEMTKQQLICVSRLMRVAQALPVGHTDRFVADRLLRSVQNIESGDNYGLSKDELVGTLSVTYCEDRNIPGQRRYANPSVELFALGNKCGLRGAGAASLYVDMDLQSAYQVIVQSLCRKHDISTPVLDAHVANVEDQRQQVAAIIGDVYPETHESLGGQPIDKRKAAKEVFLAIQNGGSMKDDNPHSFVSGWRATYGVTSDMPECVWVFHREMREVIVPGLLAQYPDLQKEVKTKLNKGSISVLFYLCAMEERKALDIMIKIAAAMGIRADSLQHDGAYFRLADFKRHDVRPQDLATKMTKQLRMETKMQHTVCLKPITCPPMPSYHPHHFSIADFVPALPLNKQIEWCNRYFCVLEGMKDAAVARMTYAKDGSIDKITLSQVNVLKQLYPGMHVVIESRGKRKRKRNDDEGKDEGGARSVSVKREDNIVTKTRPLIEVWLKSPQRRSKQNIGMFTTQDEYKEQEHDFNAFTGFKFDGTKNPEANISILLNHIQDILCDGNVSCSEYFLNWMAHLVQYRTKPGVIIALCGGQGSGKSVIASSSRGTNGLIPRIWGEWWCPMNDIESLLQKHNADAMRTLFVTLEEVTPWKFAHRSNKKLKDIVTGRQIRVEPKNIDAFDVIDHRGFIACTNDENAFELDADDRRFCLITCNDKYANKAVLNGTITRAERTAYFNTLWTAIRDDRIVRTFFHFLMNRNLENFDMDDIPSTRLRQEQMETNLSPVLQFLMAWRDGVAMRMTETNEFGNEHRREMCWEAGKFFTTQQFFGMFKSYCTGQNLNLNGINGSSMGHQLRRYNEFVSSGERQGANRGWKLKERKH